MQSYLILGMSMVTTVAAQFLFKKGVSILGNFNLSFINILFLIEQFVKNIYLILGIILYGVAFILWLFTLSKFNLNFAYPLTSINYILTILIAWMFLGEPISTLKLIAVAIIIGGIFLLFKS